MLPYTLSDPQGNTIIEIFKYNEMADIKDRPGIYAWYYQPFVDSGWDLQQTESELKRISNRIRLGGSSIELKGDLNFKLEGSMKHVTIAEDEYEGMIFSDSWKKWMDKEETRIFFSEIINFSAPIFSNPLYIGISKNLNKRINQGHLKVFMDKDDTSSSWTKKASPHHLEGEMKKNRSNGIEVSHLMVAVRYIHNNAVFIGDKAKEAVIGMNTLSDDEYRKFCVQAETVLNRIFYPIFGKK